MKRPLSRHAAVLAAIIPLAGACHAPDERSGGTLAILTAGALARPLRVAADSFAGPFAGSGVRVALESAGSLETARKITDLGRRPSVVALADTSLFSALLAPYVGRVTPIAHTRVVLAYTTRSRYAGIVDSSNWYRIVQRPGVEVGRSDPTLDPAGYRALLVGELAERHYGIPALADSLLAHEPARNIRPKSADLVALLQTGNLDYAWEYESVARSVGLRYVRLPAAIDLGDPALAPQYAAVSVRVPGARGRQIVIRGAPVVFGIAPLRGAPGALGSRFVAFLSSPAGRRILAGYSLEALDVRDTADTR